VKVSQVVVLFFLFASRFAGLGPRAQAVMELVGRQMD